MRRTRIIEQLFAIIVYVLMHACIHKKHMYTDWQCHVCTHTKASHMTGYIPNKDFTANYNHVHCSHEIMSITSPTCHIKGTIWEVGPYVHCTVHVKDVVLVLS